MSERKLVGLLLSLCVTVSVCSAGKIPSRIGKWRVEVGPPGNDFYQAPQKKKDKPKPPSETVLRHTRIFVPHMKVTDWEYDDGEYEIRCGRGDEEYKFNVTPEGELTELQYENDETDVEEEADELVLRGTKKDIAVNEVPKAALATLAEAYPNAEPSKAWTSETIAGRRYVIQIAEMAFYARPDGQIQAGRPIDDGGLDEIYPPSRAKNEKTFKADLEKLLGPYRERFNFDNQIKRMGKDPRSADGSYRFVVMGDSRSQWALWSSMVKHIDSLDPKPAFVVNSGDAVPKGHAGEFNEYYVPPLLKTDVPFFIAIGNHDTGDDDMAHEFRYLFGENSLNYYFDYGKARFVFFDNASDASSSEQTLKWLDKTLAQTPKGYLKFVAAHKPPKNIEKWAYHAWDDEESKTFTDLMTKHKVSEVYLGHIHAYSTAKCGGVDYTISGGGGAGLHDRYGPGGNIHHYVICDVTADGMVRQQVVRFYDTNKESK
ncbi:MAG: metallophosphoesterase family protein [Planctomycetota bacterium]